MPDKPTLAVMEPRDKPDVPLIISSIRDAINSANALGIFAKLETCHLTRRCLWAAQRDDGRYGPPAKDSKNLYWWQGAPESRRHKCDEIVIERAGVRTLVLHRGQISVSPSLRDRSRGTGATDQDANAEDWQIVLDHYRKLTSRKTTNAWRLHCTSIEEFGYSILHTGWINRQREAERTITFNQLLEAIASQELQRFIQDAIDHGAEPPQEGQIAPEILQMIQERAQVQVNLLLMQDGDPEAQAFLIETIDPDMPPSEAKIVLKTLARGEDATYYAPEDDGGIPVPMALVPWVNVVHPASLTGDGESDWFAIPEWITGPDLLSRGWNKDFVDKVLEHPNVMIPELMSVSLSNVYSWVLNGAGIGLQIDQNYVDDQTPVYQIMHVWRKAVNRGGRTMVYQTVIHPLVTDSYGLHECTKLEKLPFQVDTSEPVNNAMLARGVGQVAVANQNHICDLMDGEGARAQIGSNPPLLRGADQHVPVRPGMQIHNRTIGTKAMNEFMKTPSVDEGALKLIEIHETNLDKRYFRGEFADPDTKAQQKELLAFEAIGGLTAFYEMTWHVIQANIDDASLDRIAGRDVTIPITGDQLQGESTIEVSFNVAGLSGESFKQYLELLNQVMAMDRSGTVDTNEAVKDVFRSQNPVMARKLVLSNETAAEKVRMDQRGRNAAIMTGWKPRQSDYPERQTNPQLRQEEIQAYVSDPSNQRRLAENQDCAEIMKIEIKYLEAQVSQYQDNVRVGKSVVKAAA